MRSQAEAAPVLSQYCCFSPPKVLPVGMCGIKHRARPFPNPFSIPPAVTFAPQLILIFVLAGLTPHASLAGEFTVTVRGLSTTTAALSALSGEKSTLIDSLRSDDGGRFHFTLGPERHPGLYRLAFNRRAQIDFVHDGDDVEITTDTRAIVDSVIVVRSESNRRYYAFRRLNHEYKTKSEILGFVLARYPENDSYHALTKSAFADLQTRYLDEVRVNADSTSFTGRYIRSARFPVLDLELSHEKRQAHLKAHALDHVDFSDEGLVLSDLFSSKSVEYLSYYHDPQLPKELLAKEFNRAVDSLMDRAKVSQVVYRQITAYLIEGFKQYGLEDCINHIIEDYVIKDDLCLDESGKTVSKMIEQRKHFRTGVPAPQFSLPDTSGTLVSLDQLPADTSMIVFYSTTCPHCRTMIPRLAALIRERKAKLTVLAVSLDSSAHAWVEFVRSAEPSWTHVIQHEGWNGPVAGKYFVYATPTLILLDRHKRILGIAATLEDLQKIL